MEFESVSYFLQQAVAKSLRDNAPQLVEQFLKLVYWQQVVDFKKRQKRGLLLAIFNAEAQSRRGTQRVSRLRETPRLCASALKNITMVFAREQRRLLYA